MAMKIGAKITTGQREFLGFCERVEDYAAGVDQGVEVFGFTSGEFSIVDVLRVCARKMKSPRIVISTWTAAGADMAHIDEWVAEGSVADARWIVDRSFQNRQPKLCQMLRSRFGDDAIRVQRVHCKFALLKDESRSVLVQTSANLNKNMRIENVSVSSCPVLFEAYSMLVADIFKTQVPGAGFEASEHVTASFKEVAKKPAKRKKTITPPWR